MKILTCTKNFKRVLDLCEPLWINRQHPTQIQKKLSRRKESKPTLCNRGTPLSPFRGSFINRPSVGKRFSTRTRRAFATPKNLRSGKRWLFRSSGVKSRLCPLCRARAADHTRNAPLENRSRARARCETAVPCRDVTE